MSDLTNLFRNTTPNRLNPLTYKNTLSAHTASLAQDFNKSRNSWNIGQLQNVVRKNVKKQVQADALKDELNLFWNKQREVVSKKAAIIGALTLILVFTTKIQGNIIFSLALLLVAYLLPSQALPLNDEPIINRSLKWIQPLIYCAVFYYLLKWTTGLTHREINWSLTFLSVLGTAIHSALKYYRPALMLSAANTVSQTLKSHSILGQLRNFPKFIVEKLLFAYAIRFNLAVVVVATLFTMIGVSLLLNCFNWDVIKPSNLLLTFSVHLIFQIFMDLMLFINDTTSDQLQIVRDKIPLFLSLLKLANKPENRNIHQQCLRSLYLHTRSTRFFLSTQTCKSLTYKTYMDIFNQYAEIELQRVNSAIAASLISLKSYERITHSNKTILDDLFIYIRKANASIQAEYLSVGVMQILSQSAVLLRIIVQTQKEASDEQEPIRVSSKIVDLISSIKNKIVECGSQSAPTYSTRQQLTRNSLRMDSWVTWLKMDYE